jgi:hypothetical protein
MAGDKSLIQFQVLFEKKQNERKRTRFRSNLFRGIHKLYILCICDIMIKVTQMTTIAMGNQNRIAQPIPSW